MTTVRAWLTSGRRASAAQGADFYGPREEIVKHDHGSSATSICLENYDTAALFEHLRSKSRSSGYERLLRLYDVAHDFPDMSHFRLGPNMFEQIPRDWFIFLRDGASPADSELVAHGVATRIVWNGDAGALPRGWQGAVRDAYRNAVAEKEKCNTLVGLFIRVESQHRTRGWAEKVVEEMRRCAERCGLTHLIIPLRLPTRYRRENAAVPFEEFASRTRDDGQPADHWLRLHVRLGATVIGTCRTSHQHAMHLDDFYRVMKCDRFAAGGAHLIEWNGEWYQVHVDLEREFVLMSQGCVWVSHAIGGGGAGTKPSGVM